MAGVLSVPLLGLINCEAFFPPMNSWFFLSSCFQHGSHEISIVIVFVLWEGWNSCSCNIKTYLINQFRYRALHFEITLITYYRRYKKIPFLYLFLYCFSLHYHWEFSSLCPVRKEITRNCIQEYGNIWMAPPDLRSAECSGLLQRRTG